MYVDVTRLLVRNDVPATLYMYIHVHDQAFTWSVVAYVKLRACRIVVGRA